MGMGKKYYNFSGFIFHLLLFLIILGSCDNSGKKDELQPVESVIAIDSLLELTGDAQLDSLLLAASKSPRDTNLVKLLDKIGDFYQNSDFEKAKAYYLKSGELSEQLDWNKGRLVFASSFTTILNRESLADSAIAINMKALELAKRLNDEGWIGNIYSNIGASYRSKEWNEKALTYYMDALSIFEKRNETKKLEILFPLISQIYSFMGVKEKAIEYGEKAFALNPDDLMALFSLGSAYSYESHNYEKANQYFEKALKICIEQNNIYAMGIFYYHLGKNALMVLDLDKAENYARKALEIHRKIGNISSYCDAIIMLGKLEQLRGRFVQAEKYAKEALEIAIEYDMLEEKRYCYQMLSELAISQRNNTDYMKYWKEGDLVELAIANEKSLKAAQEMEVKYETEKKQFEIERQQRIIAHQNLQRWLLAGGIAVCVVFLILLWYMLQLRTRRNHLLAEMNVTKDKFFSIISHDLKNPAIAQRDALQLLIKNAHLWDIDSLTEYYHELLKSAESQVELLYNLLNWAQIQTGRMAFTPIVFHLPVRLRSDISLIRKMAENKGIALNVDMPEDALVTGDSNMIVTVIRNLLTNAVKFTNNGGTVTLEISQSHNKYTVSVIDTGIGMNEEYIRNLLGETQLGASQRHFRRGTANEQSSGLGIIVCKELLEKHGSILHIESKEGAGSRFWFEI